MFLTEIILASLNTSVKCDLSLNGSNGRKRTISRCNFVCPATFCSIRTVLKSFQLSRLIVIVCMRYCNLGGWSMSVLIICLFQRRWYFCTTAVRSYVVVLTIYASYHAEDYPVRHLRWCPISAVRCRRGETGPFLGHYASTR